MSTDRTRRRLFALGSLALSAALLWWALRDTSLSAVVERVADVEVGLLSIAILLGLLSLPVRAVRWKAAITHLSPEVRTSDMYHATAIGALANNVLPARMGEVVGSAACARLARIPLASAGASLVLVHVLDALVIGGLGALALAAYPSSEMIGSAGTVRNIVLLGLLASAAILTVMAVLSFRSAVPPTDTEKPVRRMLRSAIDGLGALGDTTAALTVSGWTVVLWLGTGVAWWAGLRSFGLDIDLRVALVTQTVVALGIALPSAPGFFGPFESGARVALSLFLADSAAGAEAAVGFHVLVFFLPVVGAGLISLAMADLSLKQLTQPKPMDRPGHIAS